MTLTSMTGFGQAIRDGVIARVKVEIRTVNHRFAEVNLRMPRDLFALEEEVRGLLAKRIARGRADVFVSMETLKSTAKTVAVNWDLLDVLYATEKEARIRYPDMAMKDPAVSHWLTHPDVVQVQSQLVDADEVRDDVLAAVDEACTELLEMRMREGTRVAADLAAKIRDCERVVETMESQAQGVSEATRTRLLQRLGELGQGMDEQRLVTEIALMVDRMCIDEELVRLRSHISEFERSLAHGSPIGRRLDFIVQEMHREVNTIGSKSGDLVISKAVVDAKTIVEQLREQAQNIE